MPDPSMTPRSRQTKVERLFQPSVHQATAGRAQPCICPRDPTATIYLLAPNPRTRLRLLKALSEVGDVRCCDCAETLIDLVAGSRRGVVVADAGNPCIVTPATLAEIVRANPLLPVLAYCQPQPSQCSALLALGRAGVREVILAGVDDPKVVVRQCLQRDCVPIGVDLVIGRVIPIVPPAARRLMTYAISHSAETLTVDAIASAVSLPRRTLAYRLERASLPSPRALMTWAKLLVAIHLLEDARNTAERVGLALDFPSTGAFRNVVKRYAQRSVVSLRGPGGFAIALSAFRQALRRATDDPRRAHRPRRSRIS
jgi:AraC-like DNA-binding protein